ncbi:F-box domain-containing protein [Metarhizium robertsii ARSEF 23]|nr:F-box domain-containing protein [Metarhizium robertsii ARSEF 23]KHO11127.1 F-box domain-containing protein [Metarhizium robertsii ARSEF 23]
MPTADTRCASTGGRNPTARGAPRRLPQRPPNVGSAPPRPTGPSPSTCRVHGSGSPGNSVACDQKGADGERPCRRPASPPAGNPTYHVAARNRKGVGARLDVSRTCASDTSALNLVAAATDHGEGEPRCALWSATPREAGCRLPARASDGACRIPGYQAALEDPDLGVCPVLLTRPMGLSELVLSKTKVPAHCAGPRGP